MLYVATLFAGTAVSCAAACDTALRSAETRQPGQDYSVEDQPFRRPGAILSALPKELDSYMSLLFGLLIGWGVLTIILILLLIYRSTVSMHEDEQLFLDDASSHMAQEQQIEVVKKMNAIRPWIRVFGASSGVLLLIIAGIWIHQSLNPAQ
jgi:hypothetical protein